MMTESFEETRLRLRASLGRDDLVVPALTTPVETEAAKAFVTEASGRTMITGPAAAFAELASTKNPHFLDIVGRFVGAEKANRNGAFWTTGDLAVGEPTIKHGPLNWLHEGRHIVGSITGAKLFDAEVASDETPYIGATASMWKWLWPDEAVVTEMAAEQGKLWYSMECVSDTVICHGEAGCGAEMAYMDAFQKTDAACDHVRDRSSERRFKDPVFLGGAIIVPPVSPGWAAANATILHEAASLAETTFEQAGSPDVTSSEWEILMAQVLEYANG